MAERVTVAVHLEAEAVVLGLNEHVGRAKDVARAPRLVPAPRPATLEGGERRGELCADVDVELDGRRVGGGDGALLGERAYVAQVVAVAEQRVQQRRVAGGGGAGAALRAAVAVHDELWIFAFVRHGLRTRGLELVRTEGCGKQGAGSREQE